MKHKPTGWVAPVDRYAVPVLFNPYTGEPRDARDVQSDPQGILIVPPGKVEMLAAPTKEPYNVLEDKNADNLWWKTKEGMEAAAARGARAARGEDT